MRTALRRGIDNEQETSLVEMENAVLYYQGQKHLLKDTSPTLHSNEPQNKLLEADAGNKATVSKKDKGKN